MKRNKLVKVLGIALLGVTALSTFSPVAANAAWKKNNTGWWYTEGSSWATGWRKIDGVWYYFDKSGYMKTGWVKDNGVWYYLDKSGVMKTGWVKDNGTWYYLSASGAMKTGWLNDRGTWYYLGASGAMKTGWLNDNGTWYYLNQSGAMQTGWFEEKGNKYYLQQSGAMVKGWTTINNEKYFFDPTGAMQTGVIRLENDMYVCNNEGKIVKNLNSQYISTDNEGKITKFDNEKAKEYILANDSEFIENLKKKENIENIYFMRADFNNTSNLLNNESSYYDIKNENCLVFNCIAVKSGSESEACVYVLGLESGKIYSLNSNGGGEIYEVKDNKKVARYENKKVNYLTNWR